MAGANLNDGSIRFTGNAVDDLHRVCEKLDQIEIRLSILSVQTQAQNAAYSARIKEITREAGELHTLLANILAFGG